VCDYIPHTFDSIGRCVVCRALEAGPHDPSCSRGESTEFDLAGITFDEALDMIVHARLDELRFIQRALAVVIDDMTEGREDRVVEKLLTHIGERRTEIHAAAKRLPE
jgi:hypothetical protein